MRVRPSSNLILIHFDATFPASLLCAGPKQHDNGGHNPFDQMQWYCRWVRDHAVAAYALIPQYLEPNREAIALHLGIPLIFYADNLDFQLPESVRGVSNVWIIGGNNLPLIHWNHAQEEARRERADVVVFGHRSFTHDGHYPETVIVDDKDGLLRFRRHYFDSPSFADRWGGEASFLIVRPRLAQGMANHIIARGWGLESIGAMTRRFSLRWASNPCIRSAFDERITGVEYMDASNGNGYHNGNGHSNGNGLGNGDGHPSSSSTQPARMRGLLDFVIPSNRHADDDVALVMRTNLFRSQLDLRSPHHDGSAASHSNGAHSAFTSVSRFDAVSAMPNDLIQARGPDAGYQFTKRAIDVVISLVALILLSPILLVTALLIKLTSRGPVLFGHKRQGLGGHEFRCWKFRSMKVGADRLQETLRKLNEVDGPQFKIAADPRITRIGGFLRRSNLDELPQLLNVLRGTMSLVGPRPSPDNENQMCPAWRRARLSVKPGITGLWQVLRLRNDPLADFQEWIYYDVEYARHQSIWLDLQILLYTPVAIFTPSRVSRFAEKLGRFGICPHSRQSRSNKAAVTSA